MATMQQILNSGAEEIFPKTLEGIRTRYPDEKFYATSSISSNKSGNRNCLRINKKRLNGFWFPEPLCQITIDCPRGSPIKVYYSIFKRNQEYFNKQDLEEDVRNFKIPLKRTLKRSLFSEVGSNDYR